MAGTKESTLVLEEPNIKAKVYVSLIRLLKVAFNIKAIRIQSSKCSHLVKLPFGGIRRLRLLLLSLSLYIYIDIDIDI